MHAITVERLVAGFDEAGFRTWCDTVGDREATVARKSEFRWSWIATRLHVFIFVLPVPSVTLEEAERLAIDTSEYAIEHKGGLPRGFQTGSLAIPVLLAGHVDEQVRRWLTREPQYRFAALSFPVAVDEGARNVTFYRGRWKLGWVYRSYVTELVEGRIVKVVSSAWGT